jgi:hypothetical protein
MYTNSTHNLSCTQIQQTVNVHTQNSANTPCTYTNSANTVYVHKLNKHKCTYKTQQALCEANCGTSEKTYPL